MDIFIIVALMVVLKGTGAIYISFYLFRLKLCQWLCHWQPATNNGNGGSMPFLCLLPKRSLLRAAILFRYSVMRRLYCCPYGKYCFLFLLSEI